MVHCLAECLVQLKVRELDKLSELSLETRKEIMKVKEDGLQVGNTVGGDVG